MSDYIVNFVPTFTQGFQPEVHLFLARQLFLPPGNMVDAEHSPPPLIDLYDLLELFVGLIIVTIQNTIFDIVTTCAPESKELLTFKIEYIATHKMIDVVSDLMRPASVEVNNLKLVIESIEVFVIAIYKTDREALL